VKRLFLTFVLSVLCSVSFAMFNIPDKTTADLARERVAQIDAYAKSSIQTQKDNYRYAYDLLWSFENPQEIFNLLGSQGYLVFENAQKAIVAIMALDPSYLPPPAPFEFTINPDGTVTIGNKIQPESKDE